MRIRGSFMLAVATVLACVDLFVKASTHTEPWNFHERTHGWVVLSAVMLLCVLALAALRSWPVVLSAGVLAGGGLGNLASALCHGLSVPNPFVLGDVAFNLADTFVLAGVVGLVVSLCSLAVEYRRYLLPPRRWERELLRRFSR